mgnify:CR=1 FL=1|tara:strand:+ start:342 stop:545 length:204 start_codon:yes stop_codon:yes gene_type:complete
MHTSRKDQRGIKISLAIPSKQYEITWMRSRQLLYQVSAEESVRNESLMLESKAEQRSPQDTLFERLE